MRPGQALMHALPRAPVNPLSLLSGVAFVMDPANVVVTSGAIETFNGVTPVTQPTAGARATYRASDGAFSGQPSAVFDGVDDWYNLGNLSAWTQGEMFVALKLTADPAASYERSGFYYIGHAGSSMHYPYTDGTIYDAFGTDTRKTVGNPAASLAAAHIYNVRSSAGNWTLCLNGAQFYTTASNTASFDTTSYFGRSIGPQLDAAVAYMVLCNQVQTPAARAAFHQYLGTRFGIAVS